MTGPRVLLMTLSERTSARGNAYLAGWLGKASVVAFRGDPDKFGNPTWSVYVSEPEPRDDAGDRQQQSRPPARPSPARQHAAARRYQAPASHEAAPFDDADMLEGVGR